MNTPTDAEDYIIRSKPNREDINPEKLISKLDKTKFKKNFIENTA